MELNEIKNKFIFKGLAPYRIEKNGRRKMGYFECSCGNEKAYDYSAIKNGDIKRCFECSVKLRSKLKTKHGLVKHPLYKKWQDIKKRCYNKKVDRYNSYGGVGIEVCEDWKNDFKKFYDWSISNGWEDNMTIERIDVYGNYSPSNCKYITTIEQGFNKRNTFFINHNGMKISLAKLMYVNGLSSKYHNAWHLVKRVGKSSEFIIKKYNLNIELLDTFDFKS